jgi:hypothetical protein
MAMDVNRPPTIRSADSVDAAFLTEMLRAAMDWNPQRTATTIEQIRDLPDIWHYVDGWQRPMDFGWGNSDIMLLELRELS